MSVNIPQTTHTTCAYDEAHTKETESYKGSTDLAS